MDLATELTNLNDLRTKGLLTDQEFDRLKQALLNRVVAEHSQSGPPGPASPEPPAEAAEQRLANEQGPPNGPWARQGVVFDIGPAREDTTPLASPQSTDSPSSSRPHLTPTRALGGGWETSMSALLVGYSVVAMFAAYWCLVTGLRLNRYLSGVGGDIESQILSAADASDTWTLAAAATWIIIAVAVITWSYQVRRASESLWHGERRWSRGWAVGGFFVPFANFVIPKLALNESEKIALHTRSAGRVDLGWTDRRPLVEGTLWWVGTIISGLLSRLTTNLSEESLEEVRTLYFLQAGAFCLGAVAQMFGVSYMHALCSRLSSRSLADLQDE